MRKLLIICAFAATVAGCNSNANESAKVNYDSIRIARDQAKLDSFERAEQERKQQEIATAAAAAAVAQERARSRSQNYSSSSKSSYRASGSAGNSNPVYTQSSTGQTQATQKKGWSSAAKGAVIGGVVGAGTGVIVDKKDGRGAAIGGVIGAGTGYVIGRQKDKKTGRAQ